MGSGSFPFGKSRKVERGNSHSRRNIEGFYVAVKSAITSAGKLGAKAAVASPAVKSGTRFVREWNGKTHEVLASGNGEFVYRDKAYRSLSAIAKVITGSHQSGPRFFGLNSKPARPDSRVVPHGR